MYDVIGVIFDVVVVVVAVVVDDVVIVVVVVVVDDVVVVVDIVVVIVVAVDAADVVAADVVDVFRLGVDPKRSRIDPVGTESEIQHFKGHQHVRFLSAFLHCVFRCSTLG